MKFETVACTLRARDWKGLDNYGSNAVIVRRNKNEQPSTSNLHRGVGSKQSNGGTQYFQQDRVYFGDIALCCPANLPSGSYMYVIKRRADNEQRYNGKPKS